MVGSSASIAFANCVLNTIVADVLKEMADRLENTSDFDQEIRSIVRETMEQHGRIIFNGNNYTQEWIEEAKKRGLPNLTNTVDAAKAYLNPKNLAVLQRHHVLTEVECHARYEILLENYTKIITIEANTMLEMVKRQILPAAISYCGKIAKNNNELSASGIESHSIKELLSKIVSLTDDISDRTNELERLEQIPDGKDSFEAAAYCRDVILPQMNLLRESVDAMERLTASEDWPIPSYTDLLHRV